MLFALLFAQDSHVIAAHRNRYRHHGLEEFDRNLLAALVNALDAGHFSFERACNKLNDIAVFNTGHGWFWR
jgi:hypothetical protein